LGDWGSFSGTGYYFGKYLHKELNVPIGLIHTSWGGTPAEFWTSRKSLEADPSLKPLAQGEASCLYNAMIAPLVPFAIRGAIWYQGEANVPNAFQYRTLLPAMIRNWRTDWGQGDFPFGIVQIAPYRYDYLDTKLWPELCEAQELTAKNVPNAGLAVTVDITEIKDIHPKNKQDVGKRLALWALAKVYGKELVYSGPVYKSMTVEGDKIRLQFDHVGGGLVSNDAKPLTEFTIAGADQKFVPATAEIDGNSIVVSSSEVASPVAVRFAWRDDTTPNLSNKEGLPAGPFRTDSWKGLTER
jgi:sialate O-acetylesterase